METLVSRYAAFEPVDPAASASSNGKDVVSLYPTSRHIVDSQLLTGATGSLGVHLLHRLLSNSPGDDHNVICLVRAKNDISARERVLQILSARELKVDEERIVVLAADVTKDHLGLSMENYAGLVNTVATVIHVSLTCVSLFG